MEVRYEIALTVFPTTHKQTINYHNFQSQMVSPKFFFFSKVNPKGAK